MKTAINIFALVGPSGVGKSSILSLMHKKGYPVLEERYIEYDMHGLSNRDLLSKWYWIAQWFDGVLQYSQRDVSFLITDRCPIEVVPYADEGYLLYAALVRSFRELREYGFALHLVYIRCELHTLWLRVQDRLKLEPERRKYGEGDFEYFRKVYMFYERQRHILWDHTIDTTDGTPMVSAQCLEGIVEEKMLK